jgi:hypothetical protein
MTTTSNKGKRRSVSDATSPTDEPGNSGPLEGSGPGSGSGSGRSGKRVREDAEDAVEEKRPRGMKKAARVVDESDMVVDGEGPDGDEDGDTRCICGRGGKYCILVYYLGNAGLIVADDALDAIAESDEGGLMVECEGCNVWQHAQCMDVPEDDVPEHYYCEQCDPSLHVELLK